MKPTKTLLRACGRGNANACAIARRINALYAATSFSFEDASNVKDHINKMPFEGVLLRVDEPSDKPPHGSELHRIYVSAKTVDEKLPSLIGMGVNYDPSDMDSHETQHKVGVITKAGRRGRDVWVKGFVWKKDFPEAQRDLKTKDLGMSMELGNVYVDNEHADVWKLDDFDFTGATILKRDAAAYNRTSLKAALQKSLSAAAKAAAAEEGEKMAKQLKEKKHAAATKNTGQRDGSLALMAQAITSSMGSSLSAALSPLVTEIKASNQSVMDRLDEIEGTRLSSIAAAAEEDEEDDEIVLNAGADASDEEDDDAAMEAASEEEEDDDMTAAKNEDDDSSDDDDSSEEDGSDDIDAELADLGEEDASEGPGEVNKGRGDKNKGSKTTVTTPPKQGEHFKGNVAKGRLAAAKGKGMGKPFPGLKAAAEQIQTLASSNRKLRKLLAAAQVENKTATKKMRTQIRTMNAQLERFSELEGRRSRMPVELTNLASKVGIDLPEIKASGTKLTVAQVDAMLAAARNQGIALDPKDRMGMKNLLIEQGMLEDGVVDRGYRM